jgi:hypothetical protein
VLGRQRGSQQLQNGESVRDGSPALEYALRPNVSKQGCQLILRSSPFPESSLPAYFSACLSALVPAAACICVMPPPLLCWPQPLESALNLCPCCLMLLQERFDVLAQRTPAQEALCAVCMDGDSGAPCWGWCWSTHLASPDVPCTVAV